MGSTSHFSPGVRAPETCRLGGGPQSRSVCCGEEKIFCLYQGSYTESSRTAVFTLPSTEPWSSAGEFQGFLYNDIGKYHFRNSQFDFLSLYGSENWTLTASQRRRIEAAEMKLLRPLAGYTLYDHKENDSIRRELQITCVLDKIDEYRLNWFLHLQRMPLNRIPLKSYHYRPQGRRTIGRPKKRWREQL